MSDIKEYYLMHQQEVVATLSIDEISGQIVQIGKKGNFRLLPPGGMRSPEELKKWWQRRAVPVNQGTIRLQLIQHRVTTPQTLLLANLGLSLTDHYWVNPVDKKYEWSEVNLFTNDFKDEIGEFQFKDSLSDGSEELNFQNRTNFSPSASLQGELQKKWIIQDGKRYLIKGNHGTSYQQSINEVLASTLHKKQGKMPYTDYRLCEVELAGEKGIGCACENFCSDTVEFISAFDVSNTKKKRNDQSEYEFFVAVCVENGLSEEYVRNFLEYQILSDFAITNVDRHFNNFGVLRDSRSLKFLGMAPIFDSGNSMFWNRPTAVKEIDLLNIPVSSFRKREVDLLRYVRDRHLLEIDSLPSEQEVRKLLKKDIDYERRGDFIVDGYMRKLELLEKFQKGEKLCGWHRELK